MTRAGRCVRVSDSSEVAGARRVAVECSVKLGMGATAEAKAGLVATELATNVLKHGGGGTILFGEDEELQSLTITAFDKGRGIGNLNTAMRDGYSTAGSPGTGLGAISRAASFVDVYSLPDRGTAVFCRIDGDEASRPRPLLPPSRVTIGGICLPKTGEEQSGDAWTATVTRDVITISVADGLGHGPAAATAAAAAIRIFAHGADLQVERMMEDAHGALRPTRGAAVGIARIHAAAGRLDFAGVGNIAGAIVTDEGVRRVVSLNGIVGHEMRKVQTFSYPWTASSVLVMQSDGVSASWNAGQYPGLMQHDAALIAAVLYRDFCRGTDDATVVVAKAS